MSRRLPRARLAAGLAALALLAGAASTAAAQPVRKGAAGGAPAAGDSVRPGIEVLLRDSLHLVRGKRVGLITNHSGRDRAGTSTIDLLAKAPGVRLTALYAAEHGIRGAEKAGAKIASGVDSATGVPVYSLYGEHRAPTAEMLKDVDVLVYDMQDVGARVYTYIWTMALAADSARKPFLVLDRPNPIRADRVDGGLLLKGHESFVGLHPVAMRYGLTPGELLLWLKGTGRAKAPAVHVVPMQGYRRSMWWEDTRIPWVHPSPNLRDVDATLVYTGTVFFEGTNLSEGRGTDAPFTLVGAPWLTGAPAIAAALNARALPGVRFDTATRTIEAGYKHGGATIPMLRVVVTDRDRVNPTEVGAWMLREIRARHPQEFQWRQGSIDRLSGGTRLRTAVDASDDAVRALLRTYAEESRRFEAASRRYRIYR